MDVLSTNARCDRTRTRRRSTSLRRPFKAGRRLTPLGHAADMKLFSVAAAVGTCAVALSACGSGSGSGQTMCADSLVGTGVGISYHGFGTGTKLDVQVCVARTCHETVLMTEKGPTTWTGGGIDDRVLKGVPTISVTVRDSDRRIVASNPAVSVHQLEVTEGCTTTIYNAAVQVSPGRVTAGAHA